MIFSIKNIFKDVFLFLCVCMYMHVQEVLELTGATGGCGLCGVDVDAGIQTLDVPKAACGLNSLVLNLN